MNFREWNRKKNLALRAFKARLAKAVLDKKNPHVFSPEDISSVRRVLFLRNDNKLGDMIVASMAFRELKKQLPHIEIDVIAGPDAAQVLTGNPHINRIFIYKRGLIPLLKLGRKLSRESFDIYIDLDMENTAQTLFLLACAKPHFAFGFNRQSFGLYNITCSFDFNAHITQWYSRCFQCLGLKITNTKYDLFISENKKRRAKEFIQTLPHGRKNILVNPFAGSKHRCLAFTQLLSLASLLPDANIIVIGEENKTEPFRQAALVKTPPNLFFQPAHTDLFDVFALIAAGDVFVSPDTAFVHAACALDKEQICIYRQDAQNLKTWTPLSQKAHIVCVPDDFSSLDMTCVAQEIQRLA